MNQDEIKEIEERLQQEIKSTKNSHEAEAWANCLRYLLIAASIRVDLDMKLRNA
jgi:hypothetical protein